MNRAGTFAFRVSNNERRAIANLAERLQRSQSDAVRFIVIEAARQLTQAERVEDPKQNAMRAESHAVTA
jgi:hypothetical protein